MTRSVALFASAFSPYVGGVEEVVGQLARNQARAGQRPIVLTMRWPKNLPASEEIEGVPVRRHVFRLPEPTPRFMLAYALESRLIQQRIDRQLLHHGTSVIHIHCVSGNAFYALRAARRLCLPLVVTLHGELTMDAQDIYRHSHVLPKLLKRLMVDADAVTACSAQTLTEAQDFTGVEVGERASVIRGGVDVGEFASAEPEQRHRPYLLSVGRHVHAKGLDVLIDTYRIVLERHPEAPDLVIAGDGEERPELEDTRCRAWYCRPRRVRRSMRPSENCQVVQGLHSLRPPLAPRAIGHRQFGGHGRRQAGGRNPRRRGSRGRHRWCDRTPNVAQAIRSILPTACANSSRIPRWRNSLGRGEARPSRHTIGRACLNSTTSCTRRPAPERPTASASSPGYARHIEAGKRCRRQPGTPSTPCSPRSIGASWGSAG